MLTFGFWYIFIMIGPVTDVVICMKIHCIIPSRIDLVIIARHVDPFTFNIVVVNFSYCVNVTNS